MKGLCFLLPLYFSSFLSFSQEVSIQDMDDLSPISFATINYIYKDSLIGGLYSDSDGRANLNNKNKFDKITIQHLNYYTENIKYENITSVIYMKKKPIELSEVTILRNKVESSWVGNQLSKKNIFIGCDTGFEIATLIKNNEIEKDSNSIKKIKSLKFKIKRFPPDPSDPLSNSRILKINFYNNAYNFPSDILNKNQDITVLIKPRFKGDVIVNLDKYDIYLPTQGAFVAIEWLGLADPNGSLILDKPYNFSNIGFNRSNTKNYTFIRSKLSNSSWTYYDFYESDTKIVYPTPAILLEVN